MEGIEGSTGIGGTLVGGIGRPTGSIPRPGGKAIPQSNDVGVKLLVAVEGAGASAIGALMQKSVTASHLRG
jgi:hypothetical protein